MYDYSMFKARINRSPDGADGNGGNPPADSGSQGGSDNGSQNTPPANTPEYVSKSDFESAIQRMESAFNSRREPEDRGSDKEGKGDKSAPRFPDLKSYDFKRDGEYERFENDKRKYFKAIDKQEAEAEKRQEEEKSAPQRISKAHRDRLSDYRKDHPEFDEDIRKAGAVDAYDQVKLAVYAHKDSPAIVHHLVKNKAVVRELNDLLQDEGIEEVKYRIGELAGILKSESKHAAAMAKAASDRPPRQQFRGSAAASSKSVSMEERFSRFHNK